jgi:hypothetical protein
VVRAVVADSADRAAFDDWYRQLLPPLSLSDSTRVSLMSCDSKWSRINGRGASICAFRPGVP